MSQPILVAGAAGGRQGSTGRVITGLLLQQGIPVRALKRAYFAYPVADGLPEAGTIFAAAARDAALELVVDHSQYQGRPDDPRFRDLKHAASFRNFQHRLTDRTLDWAQVGAVHQKLVGAQDVSGVAAALVANPGLPSRSAYAMVGETPTVREMTEAPGRAIGRPTRYVAITDEQWANAVKERFGRHTLDHLTHLWRTFRKGAEGCQPTDAIRMVTGRNPQTFEEFFRESAGFFAASTQEA
jgi:hypothetical protein